MTASATASDQDRHPRRGVAHVVGDTGPELWRRTIPDVLKDTVARFSGREAAVFVEQGVRWTWAELDRETDALAGGLRKLGLGKGDRVGIWSPNRYEWVLTQYATARLGLVLVTINPAYRLAEVEYVLNKVGCAALVTAAQFKTSDYLGMLQTLAPELADCVPGALAAAKLPQLKTIIRMGDEVTPGMLNFTDVLENGRDTPVGELDDITATLEPDEPVNIQFTSGTTGAPKGATLTHVNIVNNGRFVVQAQNFTEDDRLCIPVPLYHCFGMVMGTLGCVTTGATMVLPAEGFDPESTLRAVSDEKCTALYGVPTMFVAELQHPDLGSFDLSHLRTGVMAGAPCPIEVMKRCTTEMNLGEITIAYGMTETSPVSYQTSADDPLERRVSTVGRIQPHVEGKIIDENGNTVAPGEQGELCTRGYSVMQGYWGEPERTAEAIDDDGWMHTGDLGTYDAEGYCNITGRVKDMLIRGGENVYPREVEEYLYRHPAVQEVQVFGVPDPKFGEEICAWIVLKAGETATEEDIKAFCRGQIAHYKVPRYVRFQGELPMTVTGKAQKFKMRDTMIEELGLVADESA
ncbi:MAG: AMP-binding protein [Alphaproteobacteria bacterium]|jgi:fatty-acyl-CoA synthase|nr:AMP-binding protein [Alphaproteobacteria bacterium]MDP6564046.1 AMP-binding protein [Alphaproteobacteria bacterium]MDP6812243.1 AMP-binding protein [Alphaproteobacteria bacterium]